MPYFHCVLPSVPACVSGWVDRLAVGVLSDGRAVMLPRRLCLVPDCRHGGSVTELLDCIEWAASVSRERRLLQGKKTFWTEPQGYRLPSVNLAGEPSFWRENLKRRFPVLHRKISKA